MTDVLDRLAPEPVLLDADPEPSSPQTDRGGALALAAVSLAGAAIHVAMAPPHFDDATALGVGFLVAGWTQLMIAAVALVRPSRRLWVSAAAVDVALIGTWAVSRTAGLPFGEHAGHPESMTIVDITAVALEVVALLLIVGLLAARRIAGRALAVGIPVLAVAAASIALASPDARGHAHDDDGVDAAHAHVDDTKGLGAFSNGHAHEQVSVTLDTTTQAALDRQLTVTRELATEFPSVQAAVDAGYRRVGPYIPGLGIHYIKTTGAELNGDGVMDDEDLRHPLALLFTSHEPGAELAGYMYYSTSAVEPVGFHGRNDGWHYHEQLCAVDGPDGLDFPFGPDLAATKAQCDSAGGFLLEQTQWMLHVWTVPGYDDVAAGVFAEENPALACSDGTYYMVEYEEWVDHPLNVCRSGASGPPS